MRINIDIPGPVLLGLVGVVWTLVTTRRRRYRHPTSRAGSGC
jgi:hypothetical protein